MDTNSSSAAVLAHCLASFLICKPPGNLPLPKLSIKCNFKFNNNKCQNQYKQDFSLNPHNLLLFLHSSDVN